MKKSGLPKSEVITSEVLPQPEKSRREYYRIAGPRISNWESSTFAHTHSHTHTHTRWCGTHNVLCCLLFTCLPLASPVWEMLFTQLYLELEKCKSKPTTPASSAGYHPAGAYFSVILNGRFEPLALEQQNRIPPLFYKKTTSF